MNIQPARSAQTLGRRRVPIVLAAVFALALGVVATQGQAHAAPEQKISSLALESAYSTLELKFDKPITSTEADSIRRTKGGGTATASVTAAAYSWSLGCGHGVTFIDGNGRFNVQYYCGSRRSLPWGFKLSTRNQATVVGNINETGLRWWRNGTFAGQNAPHVVPPYYQLHGTMVPVYARNNIDFQDYITWRHNIGPGGTAALTFAGSLKLTN